MNRKRELTELASELQTYGLTAEKIGSLLGYCGQHIRNILRGQGRPNRDDPVTEVLIRLPAQLRRRVEAWRARRVVAKIKQKPAD